MSNCNNCNRDTETNTDGDCRYCSEQKTTTSEKSLHANECKIDSHVPVHDGSVCECRYFVKLAKPNTKEYLNQIRIKRSFAQEDSVEWIEQLLRYHQSCTDALNKDLKLIKAKEHK